MAYSPISFTASNYRDYANYWLKAYAPGTTTPKVMSLDANGLVLVAKLQINADGFIVSASASLVTPHIDSFYDLWLFPTEAEADANDTSNALRLADNLTATQENLNTIDFATVSHIKSGTSVSGVVDLQVGDIVNAIDYSVGCNSGKLTFEVVAANTGVDDGGSFIDLPAQGLQLKQFMSVSPVKTSAFGAMRNGISDDTVAVNSALAFFATLSSGQVQSSYQASIVYINGNTFSFCGVCTVRSTIYVPRMSHFTFADGGLAADKDNWTGTSTDFLLNFNEVNFTSGFAYNNGAFKDIHIISNKVCSGVRLTHYNRFHINNVHIKGYTLIGLQTAANPSENSHEMITDGLYIGEYDWFDPARLTTPPTGTAIYNYAHDGIWRNFVIYNGLIGVVNNGQGNDWGDFHIWGMPLHTDPASDYYDEVPGFVNLTPTDTIVHDFKLGWCSMILINPFLCVIDTWQFEREQTSVNINVFVFRAVGSEIYPQRILIKNGLIHVANPATGSGETNFITIDESGGTFNENQALQLYIADVVSNGAGTLKQTEYKWALFIPNGVSSVTYDWSNYMLFPVNTRLKSWTCNSSISLWIKASVDTTAKTVTFTNYTDATFTTTANFEQFKYIDFTIGCERA